MTVSSLVTALVVGIVVGLAGRSMPTGRSVPVWVYVAVGVGLALLATIAARLAGVGTAGVSAVEMALQLVLAASGVTLVAATADRPYRKNNVRGSQ